MRARLFGGLGLVIIAVIGLVLYFSFFVVPQTQQALVLRFGQVVAPIGGPLAPVTKPGLYFKLPFIDNVVFIEKRILDLDSPPLEIIASDQKRLVVDAFGRYRITDPLLFYQAVGAVGIANQRLSDILNSAVRRVLGDASFIQLVRDQRAQLMLKITDQVNQQAQNLGIDMVDVKIKHADLPEANSQAIYQRMQTERQREATEIRAEGEQQARRIRAEADRAATVIVAEANRESEQLRGDGDAERNRIFADAFGKDPDFFAFYRSMQAYQQGLGSNDTRMVLSPDSDFFKYFNSVGGALPSPSVPAAGDAPAATGSGAAASDQ
jgi:membrane protease subunit HflC